MNDPAIEFEKIVNKIQGNEPQSGTVSKSKYPTKNTTKSDTMPKSGTIFETLLKENTILDEMMVEVSTEVSNIRNNYKESFTKNLTFSLCFKAIDVLTKEYEYQSKLFSEYSKLSDEMCNEENMVKMFDMLRMIITDRRAILNDIINNMLKVQKLDNDRIKMDSAIGDDDEVGDMLSPDSL